MTTKRKWPTREDLRRLFERQCAEADERQRRQNDPLYQLFEQIDRLALLNRQPTIEQLRAWADALHAEIFDDREAEHCEKIHEYQPTVSIH